MKTTSLISSALIATTTLLSFLAPTSAHIAMSNPPGQAGPWSNDPRNTVHAWIGFEGKPFPCGGYKKGPVTTLSPGQIVPVRFWTFGIDFKKFPPPSGTKSARHGGGACEFSLSYDGGKSWKVIGQYTVTCPDIFFEWPVLIPKNVPACTDSTKCLFAMSWTAFTTNQFYHHCANIVIPKGASNGKLPILEMTTVDVTKLGEKMNTHAIGDMKTGKSTGPNSREKRQSTNGFYANGGQAGSKGIDLGLVVVNRS